MHTLLFHSTGDSCKYPHVKHFIFPGYDLFFFSLFRRNAVANMKAGRGPTVNLKPDEVAVLKSGGKSVSELTGQKKTPLTLPSILCIFQYQ